MSRFSPRVLQSSLLLFLIVLAACSRESAQPTPTLDEIGPQIQLIWQPDPPDVGETTLQVIVRDANGGAVEGASVDVRGDMSHAGMMPVIREDVLTDASGTAQVPFEWTMGGDWFVIITATLPDGTVVERRFDLTVSGVQGSEVPINADMGSELMPGITAEAP